MLNQVTRGSSCLKVLLYSLPLQGFVIKVPETKHNTTGWHPEGEALALTHQAGICFSLALRMFFAFGLAALYLPGPTSLLCSTILMVAVLFLTDHVHIFSYEDLLFKVKQTQPTDSRNYMRD